MLALVDYKKASTGQVPKLNVWVMRWRNTCNIGEHPKIVSKTRRCPISAYSEQVVEHPLCPEATQQLLGQSFLYALPSFIHTSVISWPLPSTSPQKRNLGPPKLETNTQEKKCVTSGMYSSQSWQAQEGMGVHGCNPSPQPGHGGRKILSSRPSWGRPGLHETSPDYMRPWLKKIKIQYAQLNINFR